MRIDLGGLDILVPQQFLDRADIVTIFQQMRGKGMPQGMHTAGFDNPGGTNRPFDRFLECLFMHMMASVNIRIRILGDVF